MRSMIAVVVLMMACAKSGPEAGTERGPCHGNGSCNDGLVCRSDLCVDALAAPQAALRDSLVEGLMEKPSGGDPKTLEEKLDALADEACACNRDEACAEKVNTRFMDLLDDTKEIQKSRTGGGYAFLGALSTGDHEQIVKALDRIDGCLPQNELGDEEY